METATFSLVVVSVTIMAAGILVYLLWPLISSRHQKSSRESAKVTVHAHDGSVVTLRNAPGSAVDVWFESSTQQSPSIVPTPVGADPEAEKEVTVLDELRDPSTSRERRREIEEELKAIGYQFVQREEVQVTQPQHTQEPPKSRPQEKPSSAKPGEPDSDDSHPQEGVDEGLDEAEPQFDDGFIIPTE